MVRYQFESVEMLKYLQKLQPQGVPSSGLQGNNEKQADYGTGGEKVQEEEAFTVERKILKYLGISEFVIVFLFIILSIIILTRPSFIGHFIIYFLPFTIFVSFLFKRSFHGYS